MKIITSLLLIASFSAFSDTFDDMALQNQINSQIQSQMEMQSKQDYYNNKLHEEMGTPYIPQEDQDYWSPQ